MMKKVRTKGPTKDLITRRCSFFKTKISYEIILGFSNIQTMIIILINELLATTMLNLKYV
jgi:hypothetical protein